MEIEIIVAGAIGLLTGLIIFFLISRRKSPDTSNLSEELKNQINKVFPEALEKANRQLMSMANQQLRAEKQDIQTDLRNKKAAIEDLVRLIKQELDRTNKRVEDNEKDRLGSFKTLSQKLEEITKTNQQLSQTTDNLRQLLTNNQLRGQFGEQIADNLLKMSGFVQGTDYVFNKEQKGSETRPDFAIFLPDGTRFVEKLNQDLRWKRLHIHLQPQVECAVRAQPRTYATCALALDRPMQLQLSAPEGFISKGIEPEYFSALENCVDRVGAGAIVKSLYRRRSVRTRLSLALRMSPHPPADSQCGCAQHYGQADRPDRCHRRAVYTD